MTIVEANNNIGQPFKWKHATSGMLANFDRILCVDPDGTVHGEFLECYCEDARLKEAQPDHLKKSTGPKTLFDA